LSGVGNAIYFVGRDGQTSGQVREAESSQVSHLQRNRKDHNTTRTAILKHQRNALQKHREEIKRLKEDQITNEKSLESWIKYATDLEDKLKVAVERLKLIADGKYYASECAFIDTNKDQITATAGLARLARMRDRKP
jgi:hypothetical protein